MKQLLVIPKINELSKSLELAEEYGLGFEFNDFFFPDILDDKAAREELTERYIKAGLPEYRTLHGAFFDVIPFSPDKRIREISDLRIRQSIEAARAIGARAVVFHTNYNPFLSSSEYVKNWIKQNSAYWSGILNEFADINIYLENMFDNSPDIMARLAEEICSAANFGICWDSAHSALTNVPQKEWAAALGKYVKHIHINDNDLVSDLHLAVGSGKIDWNEFYSLYDKFTPQASVLIETSKLSDQRGSLARLTADGFI